MFNHFIKVPIEHVSFIEIRQVLEGKVTRQNQVQANDVECRFDSVAVHHRGKASVYDS